MLSSDLRAILGIKARAEAAIVGDDDKPPSPSQAEDVIRAYDRLREEARELNERAGWSAEEFDRQVPAAKYEGAPGRREGTGYLYVGGGELVGEHGLAQGSFPVEATGCVGVGAR